jgi:putative transposase
MQVVEFKVKTSQQQQIAILEAIRIGQFIRNKCIRLWIDSNKEDKVNYASLCKFIPGLSNDSDIPFVGNLNSMAHQASAERAWFAISRFYDNCKKAEARKGYPKFKKFSRSVEYKTSGSQLSEDKKSIHFEVIEIGDPTWGVMEISRWSRFHFSQSADYPIEIILLYQLLLKHMI